MAPIPAHTPPLSDRARRAGGFAMLDVLVGCVTLAIAILGHAASTVSASARNTAVEEHCLAASTLGRFVERLRADPDWPGLYARLRALTAESGSDTGLTHLGADASLTTYPASSYYTDFTVPSTLEAVTFLVQVPSNVVGGVTALREDHIAPRYGLPYDLDGDGVIEADSRSTSYLKLPVVVRVRWKRAARDSDEIVLATWLRGER